jgi:allantoinase
LPFPDRYHKKLVIVNPETPWSIEAADLYYKNPISAFMGTQGKGIVAKTIIRREIVFDRGLFKVNGGFGMFINPRMV